MNLTKTISLKDIPRYDPFEVYKADYPVYGTHTETDKYSNERTVRDAEPRGVIHTMWHPMTDAASIAEYGKDISRMFYTLITKDPGIDYNDIIELYGDTYEVVGIKRFNTVTRVEIRRKKV